MRKITISTAPIAVLGACAMLAALPAHAAFDGSYVLDNWTLATGGSNGSVSPSSGPSTTVTLTGNSDEVEGFTDFTVTVAASGQIVFDWSYSTADPIVAFEEAGYILNGTRTVLAGNTATLISIVPEMITVSAGDTFGFYVHSFDGFDEPAVLTISNFSGPEPTVVPLPAPVLLLASALFGLGLRRRGQPAS